MKKKLLSLTLALGLALPLAACGGGAADAPAPSTDAQPAQTELIVFAAASLTETLNTIGAQYKAVAPDVELVFTFDSSGALKTQIEEGADCDLFISAAQKQMNQLEELELVLTDTRTDLLENKVVLVVPEGNPAGVTAFEDAATDRVGLIALGNSDVPVGQYAEEIFTSMGMWTQLNDGQKITFGTNVKEVTAQVAAAAVDCGVMYGTDAFSAGLEVAAQAPEGTHSPVIYPAAVLNGTRHEAEARAFLDYLQSEACTAVFEAVGFSIP